MKGIFGSWILIAGLVCLIAIQTKNYWWLPFLAAGLIFLGLDMIINSEIDRRLESFKDEILEEIKDSMRY